jgi:uncharacterized PurR-regulated membrane protein YhhQ (DUF165 family)
LAAVVVANLLVTAYGPGISIVNAFVLIGLDLTVRDRLHDRWGGRRGLWLRMLALIAAGGLLSWLLNGAAGAIAVASTVAFVLAGLADAGSYALLRSRTWLERANGSNVVAAAVDSLVFPTLAFGSLLPLVVLGQFLAKVLGGLVWSLLLQRRRHWAVSRP